MNMVKDYDCEILYHPGKANMIADALNRKVVIVSIMAVFFKMKVITPLLEHIWES